MFLVFPRFLGGGVIQTLNICSHCEGRWVNIEVKLFPNFKNGNWTCLAEIQIATCYLLIVWWIWWRVYDAVKMPHESKTLHAETQNSLVCRCVSFSNGPFLGSMLIFRGVNIKCGTSMFHTSSWSIWPSSILMCFCFKPSMYTSRTTSNTAGHGIVSVGFSPPGLH